MAGHSDDTKGVLESHLSHQGVGLVRQGLLPRT